MRTGGLEKVGVCSGKKLPRVMLCSVAPPHWVPGHGGHRDSELDTDSGSRGSLVEVKLLSPDSFAQCTLQTQSLSPDPPVT